MKIRRLESPTNRAGFVGLTDGNAGAPFELDSPLDPQSLLSPPHSVLGPKFSQPGRSRLKIVMLGLSMTSSLGNGQAATYRGLVRELSARGHDVLFLEQDINWGNAKRDLPKPPFGRTESYANLKELKDRFAGAVGEADFVMVGSHLPEGIEIGEWVTRLAHGVTAFYDFDTARTLATLLKGGAEYISAALIPRYQMYLSFTGGPILDYIERQFGSPMARPLYCAVDAMLYFPERPELKWDLGYLGAYSADNQPTLNRLMFEPARRWEEGRFVVAGRQYPRSVQWPQNVKRIPEVGAAKRRAFYNAQRFTLNITPPSVIAAGFSPNVRLFEAAACGTPVITEFWPGLDTFFKPDDEILISHSWDETLIYLEEISELERRRIGYRSRERVLAKHTTRHRAAELEHYALEVLKLAAA